MGIFDLFGKEPKSKSEQTERRGVGFGLNQDQVFNNTDNNHGPVSVFAPKSFKDVSAIIDALKLGKNAIVHLTELKTETSIRVLDLLSGAIYALGGGVYEMQKNIFMFSPNGVEIN